MNRSIATIGYEGSKIGDFLATLEIGRISTLLDVREVPISRKRGFSKTALASALASRGIEYVHLRELGDPKAGRAAARRGDLAKLHQIYLAHLARKESQDALKVALEIILHQASCLLCFERDHLGCHRAILATVLAKRGGLQIRHLGVVENLSERVRARRVGRADATAEFG